MRHPEDEVTDARGDAVHVPEGTIHAWLDGALATAEREALERHVAGCAACTAAVAEARGLIAASSRILGALDAVPGGVLPVGSRVAPPADADVRPLAPAAARPTARPRAWRRWPVQAAAAVALVAVGTWSVVAREQPAASSVALDDRPVRTEESAEAGRPPVPAAMPMPAPMPAATAGAGATAEGAGAAPSSTRPRQRPPAVALDAGVQAEARERAKAVERTQAPMAGVAASSAGSARVPAVVTRPAEAVAFAAGAERLGQRRVALAGADSVLQRLDARAPAAAPGVESARATRGAAAPAVPLPAPAVPLPAPAPAPPPPPPPPAAVTADMAGVAVTTVSGRVTTPTGEPVPDASVTVPGTLVSTTTDAAGRFSLAAPAGVADSAIVRRVGYRAATVRLRGATDRTIGVVLEPAEVQLSAVTVTATAAPPVVGCYRAELVAAAPAALRRTLAEPLRLTDEPAGGAWRRVRAGARSAGGAAVARWRGTAEGGVEVQWTVRAGPRLRLRGADDGLAGEAWTSADGAPVAVALRSIACAGE